MAKRNFIPLLLLVTTLFIIYGDSWTFLPKPARDASVTSRKFVVGLWPSWLKPKDFNQQRQRDIDQLQKSPSPNR
ncbi:MAG: hypothetical protein EAZ78_22680 [Oscillatoriales cyanobacterium]|uniref:Uncharacterized protein n=1 Tax=Microcoleus anatoxicus PTRS2 TaxID=2705321 RepID=A0ABU8YIT2_9CYAN|nr:MAG: hypothetical protein EA000_18880 [Oscillatoriales cyanobacterium]TAD94143.1 MAG: hypothetical protein EAZ98_20380 [Oscillatoriales cyanobacterium]TAE02524.1 MAG: hypothetical protein EAZ96_15685 [Oscillatoriales cyanobacterium]TAE99223.1 MAG: hypothetical protein EAZ78_22680 [Oscillatoriales cyanobacterium]TAF38149.1 MAG: hypothetical protein EAZ68_13325 [Oscillatoriales cyanobacterium]